MLLRSETRLLKKERNGYDIKFDKTHIDDKILEINSKINSLQKEVDVGLHKRFTGTLFITFSTEQRINN